MTKLLDLPDINNSYYDNSLRYRLLKGLTFVFGSNQAGIHGLGAAKVALTDYGAILGIGEGKQGASYAIPTKDKKIRSLSLEAIIINIDKFKEYCLYHDEEYFFITAVGTGLAGYKPYQIAPLFKGVKRCWLPQSWQHYIED